MSTDGSYGFKKNGKYKVTMCCSSSYYEWLGQNVINFIKEARDIDTLNEIYDKIIMLEVNDDYSPDVDEVYVSDTKRRLSPQEFESITEELDINEGYLSYYLSEDAKYMIDNEGFMEDVFCKYTYVIDLDSNVLMIQKNDDEDEEECRVEYIELDYIFDNNINLDMYMQNIQEMNSKQLVLEDLIDLVKECMRRDLPLDTPIFISDNKEVRGVHINGFAQIINKNNKKDDSYFKSIYESDSNAKTKDINIIIYR